ncbi:hypothetical protein AALO_G00172900 [Alosa alosa]|uniref:Nibrin n=1 Tax=Alosa alosa TaxID=278164 RepID=A0AAV6G9R5_9TELE|nr:hypothetical protein AALO_G00172900 [Alosa alosa]
MWKLVPLQSGGETFYLLPGKEYVVGRKNCEILLGNDQSISRAHAQLSLSNQSLTLKDSSKYGTFINDAQLTAGTVQTLKSGDRLTFGVYQSKFKVEEESVRVFLMLGEREQGGTVPGPLLIWWPASELMGPGVYPPRYAFCEGHRQDHLRSALWAAHSDAPGGLLQSVKRLFAGKNFIFLNSKQMKHLSQAVGYGGGLSQLLEEGSVPVSLLESPGSCVIDMAVGSSQTLISASSRKWIDAVGQVLHRQGQRWISESEIGLAAIYVNNSTYCNPYAPTATESVRMRKVIPGPSLSQSAAVDETVLPAASQNITAYVVNTEPSQGISGPKVSEMTSKPPVTKDTPASCTTITETMMTPLTVAQTSQSEKTRKADLAVSSKRPSSRDADSAKFRAPQGALNKTSPQKQSALTNFFQPVSKKRPRDGSVEASQSELKLFRLDSEEEELHKRNCTPAVAPTPTVNPTHTTTHTHTHRHTLHNHHDCSPESPTPDCTGVSLGPQPGQKFWSRCRV